VVVDLLPRNVGQQIAIAANCAILKFLTFQLKKI